LIRTGALRGGLDSPAMQQLPSAGCPLGSAGEADELSALVGFGNDAPPERGRLIRGERGAPLVRVLEP